LFGKRADRAACPLCLFAWLQVGMAVLGLLAPDGVLLRWVLLHSMAISDYLSIVRMFQSVFPNATM
jgi:hypothetical protein